MAVKFDATNEADSAGYAGTLMGSRILPNDQALGLAAQPRTLDLAAQPGSAPPSFSMSLK